MLAHLRQDSMQVGAVALLCWCTNLTFLGNMFSPGILHGTQHRDKYLEIAQLFTVDWNKRGFSLSDAVWNSRNHMFPVSQLEKQGSIHCANVPSIYNTLRFLLLKVWSEGLWGQLHLLHEKLYFNKPPRLFMCILKSEKHGFRVINRGNILFLK